jgi:asparagine synthase (glutamine-hydrolysing)
LKTFSIGTPDSPDILAARVVAKYLDTDHTEVPFDIEEGLRVIPDVIKSLESYDTTTVRASVPMWLLCRWIANNTDCRVIISGEGSDELFGGYLYFHYAPDVHHFSLENIRRLRLIHQFDGLRADRCIAAHGLELRVPFLDREFVEVGMTIDQSLKVPGDRMEKWILREAFEGYLPHEILWRQKNGMSDAVGYSWVNSVKKAAEGIITDEDFSRIKYTASTYNPPLTKEEAMYRGYFWKEFGYGNDHLISEIWRPRWTTETDPSAAKLSIHQDNSDAHT